MADERHGIFKGRGGLRVERSISAGREKCALRAEAIRPFTGSLKKLAVKSRDQVGHS